MRILRWSSLALMVVLLASLVLPFSAAGTRLLLGLAERVLPVTIQYRSGALLGELGLDSVVYDADGITLSLQDLSARARTDCLWRSIICLDELRLGTLSLAISDTGDDDAAAPSDEQLTLPVRIVADALAIESIDVSWPGGSWRSRQHTASLSAGGSRISLSGLRIGDVGLVVDEDEEGAVDDARIVLPEIRLPLRLLLDDAQWETGRLQLEGQEYALDQLALSARWRGYGLRIEELSLVSDLLGALALDGELRFRDDWPVDARLEGQVPASDDLPPWLHGRALRAHASGDLAALALEVIAEGAEILALDGSIDTLAPELPFTLSGELSWTGTLPFPDVLAPLSPNSGLALQSPLRFSTRGDLQQQQLVASLAGSGYNYANAEFRFTGIHRDGTVQIEQLALADAGSDSQLHAAGTLNYGGQLSWLVDVQSSGLLLPQVTPYLFGRLAGSFSLQGSVSESRWTTELAAARLQGTINDLPAELSGDMVLDSERWLVRGRLAADVNGARLALDKQPGTPGSLDLEIDDVGRWEVGSRGRANLQFREATVAGEYTASGSAQGLAFGPVSAAHVNLDGRLATGGSMPFELTVTGEGIAVGDLRPDTASLWIAGDRFSQQAALRSNGDLAGELKLGGKSLDPGWTGELELAEVSTPFGAWRVSEPVAMVFSTAEKALSVAAHCWLSGEGQLCLEPAVVGETGDVRARFRGDLQLLNAIAAADYSLSGALSATLAAAWNPDQAAQVTVLAELDGLRLEQALGQGESAVYEVDDGSFELSSSAAGIAVQAALRRDAVTIAGLSLNLPPGAASELEGELVLEDFRLAPLASFASQLSTLEGTLSGAVALGGSLANPLVRGKLRLADGKLGLSGDPNELSAVTADLLLRGDAADFSGSGRLGGGELAIDGSAVLRPEPEITLNLRGDRNRLQIQSYSELQVSTDFKLVAKLELIDLSGNVTVHDGRLEHERLPEGSVSVSADIVEVDYAGNALSRESPFATRTDVRVRILDKFRVVGAAIDVTVGGDLRLQQEPRQPMQLFGNLNVIGGEVRAYGQRLEVKQGTIGFTGDVDNPELNLRAGRDIPLERIRVGVAMTGTLEQPVLEIYSDPAMPQTAALSWLMRGRGPDTGAGADGTAMALSLGAGVLNQSGVVTGINRLPGLSNVEFGAEGSEDDTAATVSGYIGERVYISYGVGIYEPINVLTARLYLQARLWLEVVSRLENSADIYYSFDID